MKSKLQHLDISLQNQNPEKQVREKRIFLGNLQKDILSGWNRHFRDHQERLKKNAALLSSLSPLKVLQRGYSITRRLSDGEIVREASRLTPDERVSVQLARGVLQARVEKIQGE
jgi:exodeoxyribonuclease VII large subunit